MSDSLPSRGLRPTGFLGPWDFPGKNTGVGCHFLLWEISPKQGLSPDLPHCRQMLYRLRHQGSPKPSAKTWATLGAQRWNQPACPFWAHSPIQQWNGQLSWRAFLSPNVFPLCRLNISVHAYSVAQLCPTLTLWTVARQAPPPKILQQERWSGLPCPPLGVYRNITSLSLFTRLVLMFLWD